MPTSPFIEAGWDEFGEYSHKLLLQRWFAAGIPTKDFDKLLLMTRAIAPVLMGTRDELMEARFLQRAEEKNAEMEAKWPEAAKKLADPQWLQQHTYIELDDVTADTILDFEDAIIREVGIDAVNGNDDYIEIKDQAEAKRWVEQAVKETGLRSLRLSAPWTRDPQVMGNVAYKLIQSNKQLQARTGWSGGVLGLGGRIDIDFASGGPYSDGVTTVPRKREPGKSDLNVTSTFEALPHEWFHALDFVVARETLYFSHGEPLSRELNNGGYRLHRHGEIMNTMEYAIKNMERLAPEWSKARTKKFKQTDNEYWQSDVEMLAFAFEGQIRKMKTTSAGSPSMYEADLQSPMFDALFNAAADFQLGQRPGTSKIDPTAFQRKGTPRLR